MEIVLVLAAFTAFTVFKSREQKRRIALLASYLGRYDIEKLMETLMDGYLRALGEGSAERQAQVWEHLHAQEDKLRDQFQQFAAAFADVWADSARVSTLPIAFPWADKLFPAQAFDLRHALQIHARGIDAAVSNVRQDAPKDRAFTLTAELMLMQHTCHWFCRSKNVASARLLARHQTHYHQVLAAVSEKTRMQYTQLIQHKA
ncbi:MAG TPA: hypothetical protein PLL83_13430 [Rhodoferax sp.]|jgi:hypothetical protein|nr:hypothetical protein [Rhodoferax sp.]HPW85382.1 hypothetical protein [Rhodoferax sp.]HQC85655.1 hypothetical protein [Rhodoferax sp.]HQY76146.1 hypothetical protein [Rhodoferax sp.]